MANPEKPAIDYSYEGFQSEQQDFPFPGTNLDNDLAELKRASDDTIDALADIRRSDGALRNGVVTVDSLAPSLLPGLSTGMNPSVYDPEEVGADVFDRANHSGAQAISTVTGLQTALDGKQAASAGLAAIAGLTPTDDGLALLVSDDAKSFTTAEKAKLSGILASETPIGSFISSGIFQTDFKENGIASTLPPGFTSRWVLTNLTPGVQVSGAANGKALGLAKAAQSRTFVSFDALGEVSDVEILARIRFSGVNTGSATATMGGLVARGSGADATETGFVWAFRNVSGNQTQMLRTRLVAGSASGATVSYTWAVDTAYYMRIRLVGTNAKLKVWPALDSEPEEWTVDETNSTVTGPGRVGFYADYNISDGNIQYEYFATRTDGGTVPLDTELAPAAQRPFRYGGIFIQDQADPTTGVNIFQSDEILYAAGQTALTAPFVLPTFYSGNVTVTTSDPWERIFKNHRGDGTITLANGTYTLPAGEFKPYGPKLYIQGANPGGATIVGKWAPQMQFLTFDDVVLQADGSNIVDGDCSYVLLLDTDVVSTGSERVFSMSDGHFHVTNTSRATAWTLGTQAEVCDFDTMGLKFIGSSTYPIVIALPDTFDADGMVIIMDACKALFAGVEISTLSPSARRGWGIYARRNSTVAVQGYNKFHRLKRAFSSHQYSRVHVGGSLTEVSDNTIAFYKTEGGELVYDNRLVGIASGTANATLVSDVGPENFEYAGQFLAGSHGRAKTETTSTGTVSIAYLEGFPIRKYGTTLTGDLTVNFSATQVRDGAFFRVIAPASLGGFTMTVNSKSLTAIQWAEWVYEAATTSWVLVAQGTLT